jgi:thioesterase domain-containing protein
MHRNFYSTIRNGVKSIKMVTKRTSMIALQPEGDKPALFMVDSFPHFIDVVSLLGADRPVMSLIAQETTQTSAHYSIVEEAAVHVSAICAFQPHGPYMLGGCSASAIVAYETAQQLRRLGHQVSLLVIFDEPNPEVACDDPARMQWRELPRWMAGKFERAFGRNWARLQIWWSPQQQKPNVAQRFAPLSSRIEAATNYVPAPYPGRFLLFKRNCQFTERGRYLDREFGWGKTVTGQIEVYTLSAKDHLEIFQAEHDRALVSGKLRAALDQVADSFSNLAPLQSNLERDDRSGPLAPGVVLER